MAADSFLCKQSDTVKKMIAELIKGFSYTNIMHW